MNNKYYIEVTTHNQKHKNVLSHIEDLYDTIHNITHDIVTYYELDLNKINRSKRKKYMNHLKIADNNHYVLLSDCKSDHILKLPKTSEASEASKFNPVESEILFNYPHTNKLNSINSDNIVDCKIRLTVLFYE